MTSEPREERTLGRWFQQAAKRTVVTVLGVAVLIVGVALLVLPGPGWAVIFAGLALLATEYDWAHRLYTRAKARSKKIYDGAKDKVAARRQARADRSR